MDTLHITRYKVNHEHADGFTLIEIVIVIAIVGIISASLAPIITQFMNAYEAELRRGALVDRAQLVLDRISREVRLALPNSIRVDGGGITLELLRTLDGGRYSTSGTDPLDEGVSDNEFNTIGLLDSDNCSVMDAGGTFITINNLPYDPDDPSPGDAYQGLNIAPITDCTLNPDNISHHIVFTNTLTGVADQVGIFVGYSELHRFQVIDTPVSYICANNAIRRYDGYPVSSAPVVNGANFSAIPGFTADDFTNDLLVDNVVNCLFSINQNAVLTISVTIQSPASGDKVTLMQQVNVPNSS